ncbi:MAG: hypothetical protein AAF236_16825 [Verrucomicrobiota bacterium]
MSILDTFMRGERVPGVSGSRDEKTGVTEITISVWVDTVEETLTIGDPNFMGLELVSRTLGNWDAKTDLAGFQVDLNYAGGDPELLGQESWSFDTSFRNEPIEKHPHFPTLRDIYGGEIGPDGRVVWPETVPAELRQATRQGLRETAGEDRANPMFGTDSYLVFAAIAKRSYVTTSLTSVFRNVGRVVPRLPGDAPDISFDEERQWLKMAPKPSQVGDQWNANEEFLLSPEGGWPPNVHRLIGGI